VLRRGVKYLGKSARRRVVAIGTNCAILASARTLVKGLVRRSDTDLSATGFDLPATRWRKLPEVGLTARFIGDQDAKEDRGISRPIFAKLIADKDDIRLKELGRTLHKRSRRDSFKF